MWNKRGLNQIDWVISLAIFILYISWFFLLIRPYYFPIEEDPEIELLEDAVMDDLIWTIYKTPLVVFSDIDAMYEPVEVNFSLGLEESHFAFADNRYFTLFENNLYFLADLKKGSNLFRLVNSDETYEMPNIHTDLYATNYSTTVSSMRATYHDGLLKKAYYKGDFVIDDLKFMCHDELVDVDNSSFFSSKIMAVHSADTAAGFNHSSTVFGYNTRIYNKIKLDKFIDKRTVNMNMKLRGYPRYYADNVNFGQILHEGECANFDKEYVFFYNDDEAILFAFDNNETEIKFCYSAEDEIELNISIKVEREAEYKIYFEPFAIIPNGDFSEGWKDWSFVNNTKIYRTCTSKEGNQILLTEENSGEVTDPYYSYLSANGGDWEASLISGLPTAGFGSNKANMAGAGGEFDGMLVSSPFTVPDYAEFIHVWRHFELNNFSNHNDSGTERPDGIYFELRDADTEELVYIIDSWEPISSSVNYDIIGEKNDPYINISKFRGRNLKIVLELGGFKNSSEDNCEDSNDADALVQIDDVYFTDANKNRIKPGFDYTRIMSRLHLGDYESYFGMSEKIEGISIDKMDMIANLTYQQLISMWGFPHGKDFRITLFNQT